MTNLKKRTRRKNRRSGGRRGRLRWWTVKVVNRGEEKVRVHMNVVLRSTMNTSG